MFLVTNNSTKQRESIQNEKLKKFNFEDRIPLENIYNSGYVAAKYLLKNVIKDLSKDKVYVIGEKGLRDEMKRWGIQVVNNEN